MAEVPKRGYFRNHMSLTDVADSAGRKLNLIYLANDVAQQSRARKKDEFPRAFGPIIPEAMEIAYRGVTAEVQTRLRRVLDVWRQRGVFPPHVLGEIDQRLEGYFTQATSC
jgi:regulator of Ty1 transposition protein 103